ncbi:hypothetical protein DTO207G8_8083 [Paecilomyces variotii]|nr:hypothetical protein DTO207G8_8083 [Paecilomyces variotii]
MSPHRGSGGETTLANRPLELTSEPRDLQTISLGATPSESGFQALGRCISGDGHSCASSLWSTFNKWSRLGNRGVARNVSLRYLLETTAHSVPALAAISEDCCDYHRLYT